MSNICDGSSPTTCACKVPGEKPAVNELRMCTYMDSDPMCSCTDCGVPVGRDGTIRCCNTNQYSFVEHARAAGFAMGRGCGAHD